MKAVVAAVHFACQKHASQRRKNAAKDPYINHPVEVMHILSECGIEDAATLCAAVLHDTLEDTNATKEEVIENFGQEVYDIVMDCSDDKSLGKIERKRQQIIHAAHVSPKAKLVKLADKYSNIAGLLTDPPAKWSPEIVLGYVRWGFLVCQNLYGENEMLDKRMQDLFAKFGVLSVSEEEIEGYYALLPPV
jgi:guanosine-3',5'-bis(diphosphate) 3'-pyrophosphohydrolase